MNVQTTATNELFELLHIFFEGKLLFLARTTEESFSVIKVMNDGTSVNICDGDSMNIHESY